MSRKYYLLPFLLLLLLSSGLSCLAEDDPFWTFPQKLEGAARFALSPQERDVTFIINDAPISYRQNDEELGNAERQLSKAISIARSNMHESPWELILLLDAYGALAYRRQDYLTATKYFEESLNLRRTTYGPDSLETAEGNDFLALAARVSGDCDLAVRLYLDSISIRENVPEVDALTLGESYMRLACAYFDKLDTARALEAREHAYRLVPSLASTNGRPVATSIFPPPIDALTKLVKLPTTIIDRDNIDEAEKAAERRALPKVIQAARK